MLRRWCAGNDDEALVDAVLARHPPTAARRKTRDVFWADMQLQR
ncbi:hypothetical protein [Streptomyces fradiae]